ncbi:MAG: pilus assembly protein N-terminal domain-containing protein, partial [Xanthobacteraceae bacterium]
MLRNSCDRNRANLIASLFISITFFAYFLGSMFGVAYAQSPQSVQHLVIAVGKSITLPVPAPFSSAVVGSPDIADAMPMTDRTLYVQGRKIGTTNI